MHPADDRLIVALDFEDSTPAEALVGTLGDAVSFYKIGNEAVVAGWGIGMARDLKAQGKKVFLDIKSLDIGATMAKTLAAAARHEVDMVNFHARQPKNIMAAMKALEGTRTRALGVTVLTDLDDPEMWNESLAESIGKTVLKRALMVRQHGGHGVVASAWEAEHIRAFADAAFDIVTPGIRLPDARGDDQVRVATPHFALAHGASHIVVGRPITTHKAGPVEGARLIRESMALAGR
jgi:orotidine-5'-phosphate decarboxylase